MSTDDYPVVEGLEAAIRDELVWLWDDLHVAQVKAGRVEPPSICCMELRDRILRLSRLVGVTSWREVDVELLRNGTYESILVAAGLPYEPVDWEQVNAPGV